MAVNYDVSEVINMFRNHRFSERADLMTEIQNAMRDSLPTKLLIAEIGEQAFQNSANPVQVIGLGLWYGIVLGILMEKERLGRKLVSLH